MSGGQSQNKAGSTCHCRLTSQTESATPWPCYSVSPLIPRRGLRSFRVGLLTTGRTLILTTGQMTENTCLHYLNLVVETIKPQYDPTSSTDQILKRCNFNNSVQQAWITPHLDASNSLLHSFTYPISSFLSLHKSFKSRSL